MASTSRSTSRARRAAARASARCSSLRGNPWSLRRALRPGSAHARRSARPSVYQGLKTPGGDLGIGVARALEERPAARPRTAPANEPRLEVDGRRRVVIDGVRPSVAGGHPVKRVVGDQVVVEADLLIDGHDQLAGVVRYRRAGGGWQESPLVHDGNDTWRGAFVADQ